MKKLTQEDINRITAHATRDRIKGLDYNASLSNEISDMLIKKINEVIDHINHEK